MSNSVKRSYGILIAIAAVILMMCVLPERVFADPHYVPDEAGFDDEGYRYVVYEDSPGSYGSPGIKKYDPSQEATDIIIPTEVTYNNVKLADDMQICDDSFAGNGKIQKIAIPKGVVSIGPRAFKGCSSLTEVSIQDNIEYGVMNNSFADCPNLKTYRIGSTETSFAGSGIGQDSDGNIYPGVTAYIKKGSQVDEDIKEINSNSKNGNTIKVVYVDDPYAGKTVDPSNATDRTKQKGKDGTPTGAGASIEVAEKAILAVPDNKDPEGSKFGLLQLKFKKVAKNKLTIGWKKVSGAKKYIVYGNLCGKKNKVVKLNETTKTSKAYKKVNGAKLKKGKYYKFVVVALDGNDDVVSTSKMIHAATAGGKKGNHKKVTTKAKKNKVSIKVKKTFKLKGKAIPKSKKLKVSVHRKVAYESGDTAIATVNGKGVIKGVKKGKCTVYCYAQNGVMCAVKVTVK